MENRPLPWLVNWQQFTGWDQYDAVHVSTHGVQICPEADECFTVVTAGDVATELVLSAPGQGVDLVIAGTEAQATETVYQSVGLSTDFFTEEYPGGLSDTIVYFSACQTTLGNDLELALAGDEAAVLGWTESVWSDTGRAAALAFWQELGDKGIPATAAYEALGGLTVDRPNGDGAIAVLSIHPGTEESPRVREIPYPRNPLNSKDLPNDTPYPIIGAFEDGQPDRIPYMIKVDGVEGDPSDFTVHVDINGFSADPKPLSEGMMIDADGNVWQVEGDIPVTFDAQYGQEITIKARVVLPEGGESEWEEDAILGEFSLRFRSTIVVEADESFLVRTESKTRATVSFAPDEGGVSFPVSGILTYEAFNIELSGACTGNAITFPGTLRVLDADLRVENGRLAVPDFVSLWIPPTGVRETAFLTCNGITITIPLIQFFAGFYSFHGGGLCGAEAEYDEANPAAGIVITGWSAGSGEVAARKTYDRSCTDVDGVTTSENTTIEIIYPPMDEQ